MTTQEVANKLVEYCRESKTELAYQELYSPNIISIEPAGAQMEKAEGMEAVLQKGQIWEGMIQEYHSTTVGDPIVVGNHFSLPMSMEVTYKGALSPSIMEEICVYEVKDGRIVKEQFFYES